MYINERQESPSEVAWREYKDLICITLPKRIKVIEYNLQQNGTTIFASEVLKEFNNLRMRLDNLQQQYNLTESSSKETKLTKLTESDLHNIVREAVDNILRNNNNIKQTYRL